jgi:hypothetical protein
MVCMEGNIILSLSEQSRERELVCVSFFLFVVANSPTAMNTPPKYLLCQVCTIAWSSGHMGFASSSSASILGAQSVVFLCLFLWRPVLAKTHKTIFC